MSNPKENNFKELVRGARKLQKILDVSIEKVLNKLKQGFGYGLVRAEK